MTEQIIDHATTLQCQYSATNMYHAQTRPLRHQNGNDNFKPLIKSLLFNRLNIFLNIMGFSNKALHVLILNVILTRTFEKVNNNNKKKDRF